MNRIKFLSVTAFMLSMVSTAFAAEGNMADPVAASDTVRLNQAGVVAGKGRVTYKIDRQSLNSSAALTSSGGTAADILLNSSSVLSDADGNVSFRGSGNFLVYVDGKLSPLEGSDALRQIPAGSVEDIEIITTPSARYRTDGDAAIINIKTKKAGDGGVSGIVNLSGSTLGTWSTDGTVNMIKGRSNWYVGWTAQDIKSRSDFRQTKATSVYGIGTVSESDGERWRRNGTTIGRAGWRYSDGIYHSLSLEVQGGETSNWRGGDVMYDENREIPGVTGSEFVRYQSHDRYNLRKKLFQASLDYVWTINDRNELSATSRFRYDGYSQEYTESNLFDMSGDRFEGTRGYECEHHWDCDGSITHKLRLGDSGKLESGYQYTTYSEHGDYKIKYWDRYDMGFEWQDEFATPFYYRRQVHSLYSMFSGTYGRLMLDAGIRGDRVTDELDIDIVGADRNINYQMLFPSAHLSYATPSKGTFTAGYSFRTNRPGIWNLEPYITYEDYYTKKIGNPDIRPEYIYSAEMGWHKSYPSGNVLSAAAFYKYRKDISEWIRKAYEPGVTLDMIVNAGNQSDYGLEADMSFKLFPWWSSNPGGSVSRYDFHSMNDQCTDASGYSYLVNWVNAFSLPKGTAIQFDSHFVGPKVLSQGQEKAYCHFDLAVRRKILSDRMSLAMVAYDIFRTARYYNQRSATGLLSKTWVRPKYPHISLSLSYNFNSSPHKAAETESNGLFEGKDF